MKLLVNPTLILIIKFTNNNILCTLINIKGNVLIGTSAGIKKIKGTKKISTTTISLLIKKIYNWIKVKNFPSIHIKVKGTHKFKTNFIKYLKLVGFNILTIQEKLYLPHSGCKQSQTRKL